MAGNEKTVFTKTVGEAIEDGPAQMVNSAKDKRSYWDPENYPLHVRLADCAADTFAVGQQSRAADLYILAGALASLAQNAATAMQRLDDKLTNAREAFLSMLAEGTLATDVDGDEGGLQINHVIKTREYELRELVDALGIPVRHDEGCSEALTRALED